MKEAPQSHSFGHYPKVMTMGAIWTVNQLVNREIHLKAQLGLHNSNQVQHLLNFIHCTNLAVNLMLNFTIPQTQSYQNNLDT